MKPTHSVDQIYVISDLHIGGEPGFQIFGSADELSWLINHLAQLDPEDELALVINGDFIDFLAEAPATYFDPSGAIRKLERVACEDKTFEGIFDALRNFVGKRKRRLIVNLGNHDLELALPWVRQRLADILAGSSQDSHSRLHLVFDGSGVLCQVGLQSVLCLHGNEVDRWNPADFEKIRQIGRDVQLGRPVTPWVPNAGTKMVIDVMNEVKRHYPFVDLLKPEKEGVVPTLAACAPDMVADLDRLGKLVNVGLARAWAGVRKPDGMLGVEPSADGDMPEQPSTSSAQLFDAGHGRQASEARSRELMRSVEAMAREGIDPLALVEGIEGQQLDAREAFSKWFRNRPTDEVLAEALEKLDKDRSFDIGDRDDTAKQLDAKVSPAIDIVIAGHTHLERALHRMNGGGCYFNSGTWARLIRIDPAVRADRDKFKALFEVLQDGGMARLDAQPGLVHKPCTVVAVWREGAGGAAAELRHVKKKADGTFALCDDMPGSRMRVG